ncbi:MAG: hypothetical protein ACRDBO_00125 [Lachnospiraceae bacterium]
MNEIDVFCGFFRLTVIKVKPLLVKESFMQTVCFECDGSGIFDCGITEVKGTCVCCKGTGVQYIGMI